MRNVLTLALLIPHLVIGPSVALASTADEHTCLALILQQLQRIDTTGVPPTASVVSAHAADRDDVVRPSLDRAEALANAPDAARQAGLFRVPRVIG